MLLSLIAVLSLCTLRVGDQFCHVPQIFLMHAQKCCKLRIMWDEFLRNQHWLLECWRQRASCVSAHDRDGPYCYVKTCSLASSQIR